MNCLHPAAPHDEELLRFALDGEALREDAKKHLEQCKTCQQRLTTYKNTNAFLVSHLYRSQCPSSIQLSLYCFDLLPGDERVSIASHVRDCPLCAAEVADTRQFREATRDIPLRLSPVAALRRTFATLVKQQAQLVLRGDAQTSAWPRQYHAGSIDLSLHLSRASSGEYILLGIITSTDSEERVDAFEGVKAELYLAPGPLANEGDSESEKPLLTAQVDDLGNIVFKPVPIGEYVMIMHLPDQELIIEGLTIEYG
jgi:hypothetical protein